MTDRRTLLHGPRPASLDGGPGYLQLPKEMAVFSPPALPDDPELRQAGKAWPALLSSALAAYRIGMPSPRFDLDETAATERRFLDDLLGRGEVSAVVLGEPELRIQESVFPGLWRIQRISADGRVVSDALEVADAPEVLITRARQASAPMDMPLRDGITSDVVNAPHILAELIARSRAFQAGAGGHMINLDLVPMSDAELGWLVQTLGEGPVVILSSGYGACRIRSTRLAATWWVQYFNSSDMLILNSIEVIGIPAVACAADDDIAESAQRLHALHTLDL
ncbi:hydrogenase expression/formation protein [Thiomonas sp. FB-Cd]|uniref:hydrogenase expression/formation protein n=1 Tax=Thiomonas sp. FB-Cd TaxID=1158292 RepID=UPI0004DF5A81|nr:hydrogenase expression/formation protein [Thiomonas sp. FB-Cd]